VPELVALDLPGGPDFVSALEGVWDQGDAAFVLDRRLARAGQVRLMAMAAAGAVIEADGDRRTIGGGRPVEVGDALVVATSGATGRPKGVVLTHDAVAASAVATSHHLAVSADHDRWLACLPLAHIGGLAVITRALITGVPLTVHDGFDADAAERSGASLTSLVHTAMARIDPTRFRKILVGGSAPLTEPPPNAVTTYGMTETGSGVVYDRRPLPGLDVRIGPTGEIELRGPMLFRGYRDGLVPFDSCGYFATGDMGGLVEGRLRVDGRRGEMIITGGENVWPDAVEAVLRRVEGIAEVAVAGRPDPEWGQRVVAYVVPGETAPPSLDELRDVVKAELAAHCAPRELELVHELPKTALGKVQRHRLVADS
jgi:O-succinylbenzoic acid--CoA ligase